MDIEPRGGEAPLEFGTNVELKCIKTISVDTEPGGAEVLLKKKRYLWTLSPGELKRHWKFV